MRRFTSLRRCFSTISYDNITPPIQSKIGRNLHCVEHHPLSIIKNQITGHFDETYKHDNGEKIFKVFDTLEPIVSTRQCFDDLLIPETHISRAPSDTFYYNDTTLLRPHTSAHQTHLIREGNDAFLCVGDCYRRDEIDSSHYPVFHQMEGVRLWDKDTVDEEYVLNDLKTTLIGLINTVFGDVNHKWVDAYFPFTNPSLELEILFEGADLEVLGSGVIEPQVLENAGASNKRGWAFGLGLERLAMVLFQIPDIRLFWTSEERFLSQFHNNKLISDMKFKPFSKYPPVYKDISMWINESEFQPNDLSALVRDIGGDLIEELKLIDSFHKDGQTSYCYRISFRSMTQNLTDDIVNELLYSIRHDIEHKKSISGFISLR